MSTHTNNEERNTFHAWLVTQGYRSNIKPMPSGNYNSSHVQTLWECWQAAQPGWHTIPDVPVMDQCDFGWPNSRVVLVSDGCDYSLAYLEQIDKDSLPRWKDNGSEGWILSSTTHWMDLPGAPS